MLAIVIQRYDKKSFHFKKERLTEILQAVTFYDCINAIYLFIKPFLDNETSNFEEYGAFKMEQKIKKRIKSESVYILQGCFETMISWPYHLFICSS